CSHSAADYLYFFIGRFLEKGVSRSGEVDAMDWFAVRGNGICNRQIVSRQPHRAGAVYDDGVLPVLCLRIAAGNAVRLVSSRAQCREWHPVLEIAVGAAAPSGLERAR